MISSIELSLTNKTFIRNMTTDSTRQVVTVSLDSDWPATFNCLTLTNKKRTYTRDIEIAVSNDKVVNERVDTTTTLATSNPAPSGMCVISRDCCCQMETGKRCIKNETFVKGKCNAGPESSINVKPRTTLLNSWKSAAESRAAYHMNQENLLIFVMNSNFIQ